MDFISFELLLIFKTSTAVQGYCNACIFKEPLCFGGKVLTCKFNRMPFFCLCQTMIEFNCSFIVVILLFSVL